MLDSFFPDRFLLRSQKNELYELVQEAGLSPADFRMVEPGRTMMTPTWPLPPTLRHEPGSPRLTGSAVLSTTVTSRSRRR